MLENLVASSQNLYLIDVVVNILLSFLLGILISTAYRWTHRGYNYSFSFVNTIVLLPMITAMVMMVIGNNLARAFGLVGAMSIIRFRTVVKDTRDTAFVFFALAVGLATGVGYHIIAIPGAIIVTMFVLSLHAFNYGSIRSREVLLRFVATPGPDDGDAGYLEIFEKHLKKSTLLNVRSVRGGEKLELSFFVKLKKIEEAGDLVKSLESLDGVDSVSLILTEDSGEF